MSNSPLPPNNPEPANLEGSQVTEDDGHGLNTTWFRRRKRFQFLFKHSTAWVLFWLCSVMLFGLMLLPAVLDHGIAKALNLLNSRSGLTFAYADMAIKPWSVGVAFLDVSVTRNDAPTRQRPLLNVRRIDVGLDMWRLITERELALEVGVNSPSRIDVSYDMETGAKLSPDLQVLLAGFKRLGTSQSGSGSGISKAQINASVQKVVDNESPFRLRTLDVSNVNMDVEFTSGSIRRNFSAQNMQLGLARHDAQHTVSGTGLVNGPETVLPFRMTCTLSREWVLQDMNITSEKAQFSWPIISPAVTVSAIPLYIDLQIAPPDPKQKRDGFRCAVDAPVLSIQRYASNQTINDFNFAAQADVDLYRNESALPIVYGVKSMSVNSRHLDAQASGTIAIAPETPWVLGIDLHRLEGEWQNLMVGFAPPAWDMNFSAGHFLADLQAQGYGRMMHSLTGTVKFSDVTLSMDQLPTPLHAINGKAALFKDRLEIGHLSGASQDGASSATLTATFHGDWLHAHAGMLDAKWDVALSAPQFLHPKTQDGMVSGTLISAGEISEMPLQTDMTTVLLPQMQGKFNIQDFTAIGTELPVDIQNLSLSAELNESQIMLNRVSGKILNTDIEGSATLTREEQDYSWKTPRLYAHTEFGGNINETIRALRTSRLTTSVREMKLPDWVNDSKAKYAVDLSANGPARQPLDWRPTFNVAVANAEIPVKLPYMETTATLNRGALQFDGTKAQLHDLQYTLTPGVTIAANATAQPGQPAVFRFVAQDLNTAALLDIMPIAREWQAAKGLVDADGMVELPAEFVPTWTTHQNPLITAPNIRDFTTWGKDLAQAWRNNYRAEKLKGGGTITLKGKGISYQHYSMPEARTDQRGRKIPEAAINNAHGTCTWQLSPKPKNLKTPPSMTIVFHADKADPLYVSLPGCDDEIALSGQLIQRPFTYPIIDIDLVTKKTANFDVWLKGWGTRITRLRDEGKMKHAPVQQPFDRRYELTLRVDTGNTLIHGINLGRYTGTIQYDFDVDANGARSWHVRQTNGISHPKNGGHIQYEMALGSENNRDGQPSVPYTWKHVLQLDSVSATDIQEFLFPVDGHQFLGQITASDIVWAGIGNDASSYSGGGLFDARNFQVIGSPVFGLIGRAAGLDLQKMVFNTKQPCQFTIENGILYIGKTPPSKQVRPQMLNLTANSMQLSVLGMYRFPDNSLDMTIRLGLLKTAGLDLQNFGKAGGEFVAGTGIGQLPVVGNLLPGVTAAAAQVVGDVASGVDRSFSRILAFHIGGTLLKPSVAPVPLASVLDLFKVQ